MPTILIATDNTEDAKEVKDLLAENYQNSLSRRTLILRCRILNLIGPMFWYWHLKHKKKQNVTISGYTASAA
jgi:hypothetical protein